MPIHVYSSPSGKKMKDLSNINQPHDVKFIFNKVCYIFYFICCNVKCNFYYA